MKTKPLSIFALLAISAAISICTISCRSNKDGMGVKVNSPLSDTKYQTNDKYIRAVRSGKSADINTAKDEAMLEATAAIAIQVQNKIDATLKKFSDQMSLNDRTELESHLRGEKWNFAKITLTDIKTAGDELRHDEKKGTYTYWLAIEVSREAIANESARKAKEILSKDERLRVKFDEKSFGEEIEKKMKSIE